MCKQCDEANGTTFFSEEPKGYSLDAQPKFEEQQSEDNTGALVTDNVTTPEGETAPNI